MVGYGPVRSGAVNSHTRWYWVLVSLKANIIGYWLLGGLLGIVLTLVMMMTMMMIDDQ